MTGSGMTRATLLATLGVFLTALSGSASASPPTDLGTLGGSFSWAAAISGSGQVVGTAADPDNLGHAFSWTPAGGMIDLGTLVGSFSQAFAVNDDGQVVGPASTAAGDTHAFSWTASGGMIDLGTLGG